MLVLAAAIVVLVFAQAVLSGGAFATVRSRLLARFYCLACRLLGLRVDVRGAPVVRGRALFICNHLSYLDIPVLGSVLDAGFVAKQDARHWPVLGALARLQQTVFISRDPRRAAEAMGALVAALDAQGRLIVFPEGTSSNGSGVLPFKSSLFAALDHLSMGDPALQPVTIELLAVDGQPVGSGDVGIAAGDRDLYAYYGAMRLLPHLWRFMGSDGAHVRVRFHRPLARGDNPSRKRLAALAHAAISGCLPHGDGHAPPCASGRCSPEGSV